MHAFAREIGARSRALFNFSMSLRTLSCDGLLFTLNPETASLHRVFIIVAGCCSVVVTNCICTVLGGSKNRKATQFLLTLLLYLLNYHLQLLYK